MIRPMPRPLCVSPVGARLAPLLLTLMVTACGQHHATPGAAPRTAPTDPVEVVLTVTNHHFVDITVYVEHDGQRTRVGTVTAATTQQFLLPMRVLGISHQFRLYGEAIGSPESVRTETLNIQPGQAIEWTLESNLRRSSVGVF
jgi:Flp pilus assembly protein CpaB